MRKFPLLLFAVLIACLGGQRAEAAETRLTHISVTSIGDGPAVVLIPGLASPRAVWDGVLPKLSKHRVILVQVNGFGSAPSPANAKDGMLDGITSNIASYLAGQKIERAAVVGHSMGGLIGMKMAKAHPTLVGKLMIVDALPFFGALMGPGATPDTVRPIAEQMRAAIVNRPPATQAPPNMSVTQAGRAKVLEWLRASDPATVGQALVEDATTDFTPDLPSLADIPVTVLYGVPSATHAPLTRGLYTSAYAKLPSARLVPVDGSAHFIMLDRPDDFTEQLATFLKP